MKPFAEALRPAAPLLLIGLVSCGGDLTLPESNLGVTLVTGNEQIGPVGQALPDFVVVSVHTDVGTPINGQKVEFVTGGSDGVQGFDPKVAVSDSKGEARARWILGPTPGSYSAEARLVVEGDSVSPTVGLTASAVPGAPDTLRALSPAVQPGRRGQTLAEPLVVAVVDRFGNLVPDAQVAWKAENGGGQVSQETGVTASDGTSSVTWTLGNGIGVQRATASIQGATGSPVTFTATVLF
jgi:hypothetical protein